jgi:hypothetical protein
MAQTQRNPRSVNSLADLVLAKHSSGWARYSPRRARALTGAALALAGTVRDPSLVKELRAIAYFHEARITCTTETADVSCVAVVLEPGLYHVWMRIDGESAGDGQWRPGKVLAVADRELPDSIMETLEADLERHHKTYWA